MSKTHKKTKAILNQNWSRIIQELAEGSTKTEVAKKYGVSRQVLSARLNKKGVTAKEDITAKVIILDIETSPFTAYSYNRWQVNIGDNMRKDDNITILSYSYKFLGSEKVCYEENRLGDDTTMLKKLAKVLNSVDVVIGHNMGRFDTPMINTRMIMNGLPPCKPYKIIDTLKIAKKHFRFERNTLDWVAKSLECSRKLEHKNFPGMTIWIEMLNGNDEAWKENESYNKMDVIVTEEIYEKMKPYVKPHLSLTVMGDVSEKSCVTCGSADMKPFGFHYTSVSKFQQYKCGSCGSFSRGRTNMLTKGDRENLLSPVTGT